MVGPNVVSDSRQIRSIFISDVHLGSRFSQPQQVLGFLRRHRPEHLYLVGDIIDAWALRRRWYWPAVYNDLFNHVAGMAEAGTGIYYTPGNHDDFLRSFPTRQPPVQIQDQFIHTCEDGRRMLVLHGDQFDDVEEHARWLSRLGSVGYDLVLMADRGINRLWRLVHRRPLRISRFTKQSVKQLVQLLSGFEGRVIERARQLRCDGVVCGHIHVPRFRTVQQLLYVNLGDWLENATALVEYQGGALELLDLSDGEFEGQPQSTGERAAVLLPSAGEISPLAARIAHDFLAAVYRQQHDGQPLGVLNPASRGDPTFGHRR